jgi:probable addiction module antidote protein
MPKRTTDFRSDLLEDLADPQEAEHYLNAALDDSGEMFLVALRDIAEAKQMAKVAESAGVARESIYRMLTVNGNPTYASLVGILRAVGLKLKVETDNPSSTPSLRERPQDAPPTAAGSLSQSHPENANEGISQEQFSAASWAQRKGMSMAQFAGSAFRAEGLLQASAWR